MLAKCTAPRRGRADGHYYVVKFQDNPQHTPGLVNDWLGTRLGEMIGLPMPAVEWWVCIRGWWSTLRSCGGSGAGSGR